MPIGALGLGAILSGGTSLAQALVQGIGALRANKRFNQTFANRPNYEIPEEYGNILAQYKQAYAGNMPGYGLMLGQTEQAGARARGAAERGAISSTSYGQQIGDIYQKELDAIQNLGIQQAQYKSGMLDKVTGAEGMMGQQKTEQWNLNKFLPWQTEMNRWGEKTKANTEGFWGAIQSGMGGVMDLLGTKYYADILGKLQGKSTIID
jgi:hypothetical protein